MTTKITLHEDDLKAILAFIEKFPFPLDKELGTTVEISVNASSGIGQIVTASIQTIANDEEVTVTKVIADERNW
jgi:hypothetical protein